MFFVFFDTKSINKLIALTCGADIHPHPLLYSFASIFFKELYLAFLTLFSINTLFR